MKIYDNIDNHTRYTIEINGQWYGMDQNPLTEGGQCNFIGQVYEGEHLGERITFEELPTEVKDAITRIRSQPWQYQQPIKYPKSREEVIEEIGLVLDANWNDSKTILTKEVLPLFYETRSLSQLNKLLKKLS